MPIQKSNKISRMSRWVIERGIVQQRNDYKETRLTIQYIETLEEVQEGCIPI